MGINGEHWRTRGLVNGWATLPEQSWARYGQTPWARHGQTLTGPGMGKPSQGQVWANPPTGPGMGKPPGPGIGKPPHRARYGQTPWARYGQTPSQRLQGLPCWGSLCGCPQRHACTWVPRARCAHGLQAGRLAELHSWRCSQTSTSHRT